MDLSPFSDIDPCGYPGLSVTQLKDLGVDASQALVGSILTEHLMRLLK
jgi:lipoyl(octanoyl) transferase